MRNNKILNPKKIGRGITYFVFSSIIIFVFVFPVVWMAITSIKSTAEMQSYPPTFLPRVPTLESYIKLFSESIFSNMGFGQWVLNSIVVATATSILAMTLSSLAAYSLSRFRFRGNGVIRYAILITQMLPGALMVLPLYLIMRDIHLLDSLIGLILAYTTFTLPYCTYMLKSYFDSIPIDLDEMAMIDGCNQFTALVRVIFPLAAPGAAVTFIFAFINSWNEFLFALVFINDYRKWTVPVALATFQGQYLVDYGQVFAGAMVVSVPIVVIFLLLQRYLVSGMTAGAVKG